MKSALLIVHVFTAVLLIGPVTFAASAFPRQVVAAGDGDTAALGAARVLHRVSRVYGGATIVVGVAGAALAQLSSLWLEAWVGASLMLFTGATALLIVVVVPMQAGQLEAAERGEPIESSRTGRLHAATGAYSLVWVAVLVLMVLTPG